MSTAKQSSIGNTPEDDVIINKLSSVRECSNLWNLIVLTIKLLKQLLKQFQPIPGFDTNSSQAQLRGCGSWTNYSQQAASCVTEKRPLWHGGLPVCDDWHQCQFTLSDTCNLLIKTQLNLSLYLGSFWRWWNLYNCFIAQFYLWVWKTEPFSRKLAVLKTKTNKEKRAILRQMKVFVLLQSRQKTLQY